MRTGRPCRPAQRCRQASERLRFAARRAACTGERDEYSPVACRGTHDLTRIGVSVQRLLFARQSRGVPQRVRFWVQNVIVTVF